MNGNLILNGILLPSGPTPIGTFQVYPDGKETWCVVGPRIAEDEAFERALNVFEPGVRVRRTRERMKSPLRHAFDDRGGWLEEVDRWHFELDTTPAPRPRPVATGELVEPVEVSDHAYERAWQRYSVLLPDRLDITRLSAIVTYDARCGSSSRRILAHALKHETGAEMLMVLRWDRGPTITTVLPRASVNESQDMYRKVERLPQGRAADRYVEEVRQRAFAHSDEAIRDAASRLLSDFILEARLVDKRMLRAS